jgi:DNA invertase Pin-like site-specific DNA recombinase
MIIGYIRVSTEQQSMENQKHKLLKYAQNNKMIIDEFIELKIYSKKVQQCRH